MDITRSSHTIALYRLGYGWFQVLRCVAKSFILDHREEKAAALEHLDLSIKEFGEMKMQPSLERALKHHS